MMTTTIRRNKDGRQNLTDLRKALEAEKTATVRCQGGGWIISRYYDATKAWHETPCHPRHDERAALQIALFGEAEHEEATEYHRQMLSR